MIGAFENHLLRSVALLGFIINLLACDGVRDNTSPVDSEAAKTEFTDLMSAGIRPVETRSQAGMPLEVLFFLSNDTDSAIKILPWGTPLEQPMTADLFIVTRAKDVVPYGGIVVKRRPPEPDDYMTFAAGEKREMIVDISEAYDVSAAGEYKIALRSLFLQGKVEQSENFIEQFVTPGMVDETVKITRQ